MFRAHLPSCRPQWCSAAAAPGKTLRTTSFCVPVPSGVNCPVCAVPVLPPAPSSSPAASCAVPSSPPAAAFYAGTLHFPHSSPALTADVQAFPAAYRQFHPPSHTQRKACYIPPEAMVFIMAAICTGDANRPPCPKLKFASWPLGQAPRQTAVFPASACSAPATGTSCPKPSCRDICKSVSAPQLLPQPDKIAVAAFFQSRSHVHRSVRNTACAAEDLSIHHHSTGAFVLRQDPPCSSAAAAAPA